MDKLVLHESDKAPIILCKQGEYGLVVEYDFGRWVEKFGEGSIGWTIRRSRDTSAYLVPSIEDGTVSQITLTEAESQYAGVGALEVFYVNTGETQKRISKKFVFEVMSSLQDIGNPPSPWQSYVDMVHEDALSAEASAKSILDLTATATVDNQVGTPSVTVEVSVEDDHKNMAFSFHNMKGEQGESATIAGVTASVDDQVGTPSVEVTEGGTAQARTFDFAFHNLRGEVSQEDFLKAFPTDSASGAIASYPDGTTVPVKDLKVSVEPVQDLHGYSNPWPSGGGVNKTVYTDGYNTTTDGITVEVLSTCEIYVHGTSTKGSGYTIFDIGSFPSSIEGQTVTVSVNEKTVGVGFAVGSGNGNINLTMSDTATKKTGEYTAGGTRSFRVNVSADVANIDKKYKFQLELGSTQTAWTPYSNICPITGWNGANVVRMGGNFLPNTYTTQTINGVKFTVYDDGSINVNGTASARVDYYLLGDSSGGNLNLPKGNFTLTYGDASLSTSGLYMQYQKGGTTTTVSGSATFEASELGFIRLIITNVGAVINNIKIYPMIRPASVTDATYNPYVVGNTYSIPFGQTVYGGTLDVTSGVLTIEKAMVTCNGTEDWKISTNDPSAYFYFNLNSSYLNSTAITSVLCNLFKTITGTPYMEGSVWMRFRQVHLYAPTNIVPSGLTNEGIAELKSWLTSNNMTCLVPLASPQSVQLTPTEVKSLLGQNNIFADCGDSEVVYRADPTLYISKLISALGS